jgi:kynurenine formamidase
MPKWKVRPEGSNWGEFGEDDQLGRMNLLTARRRIAAIREAREGIAFCLSLPLDYPGGPGQTPSRMPPRSEPTRRPSGELNCSYPFSKLNPKFKDIVSDDKFTICMQYSTHWDALTHWGQEFDADGDGVAEPVYYNGHAAKDYVLGPDQQGETADRKMFSRRLGLDTLAVACAQGRGVLVDLYSIFGEAPEAVGYDQLMRAFERQKVVVEPGDFLCLHTGWADLVMNMKGSPDAARLKNACVALDGGDSALLKWISDSGIVAICADNEGVEHLRSMASGVGGHTALPLHELCLFKLGVFLGEMWHFGEIASWLRAHERNRFLLTAPPLRMPGCVGSPTVPVGTV